MHSSNVLCIVFPKMKHIAHYKAANRYENSLTGKQANNKNQQFSDQKIAFGHRKQTHNSRHAYALFIYHLLFVLLRNPEREREGYTEREVNLLFYFLFYLMLV